MRGHTVLESLGVERKLVWVEPLRFRRRDKRIVFVNSLTTRRYLKAAKEKIETFRIARVVLVLVGIEGPLCDRVVKEFTNTIRLSRRRKRRGSTQTSFLSTSRLSSTVCRLMAARQRASNASPHACSSSRMSKRRPFFPVT